MSRPKRNDRDGPFIYFIQAAGGGPIKIGWTRGDPQLRLAELQMASPQVLEVLSAIQGVEADERWLHEYFADHRLHGEWFEPVDAIFEVMYGEFWPERPSLRSLPVAEVDPRKLDGLLPSTRKRYELLETYWKAGGDVEVIAVALGESQASVRKELVRMVRLGYLRDPTAGRLHPKRGVGRPDAP